MLSILFSLLLCNSTQGQSNETTASTNSTNGIISITTNPTYFVLGGYHITPWYHFPKKWSIGSTLQGGFDLPTFARDQFFESTTDNFTIDWRYAVSVDLKYRFTDAAFDKGFYTTISLGYEGWTIEADGENTFDNWFTSINVGYNWFPFARERFHLGAHYSLIFLLNNTNERQIGDNTYRLRSIVPPSYAPSIFLGWRF